LVSGRVLRAAKEVKGGAESGFCFVGKSALTRR